MTARRSARFRATRRPTPAAPRVEWPAPPRAPAGQAPSRAGARLPRCRPAPDRCLPRTAESLAGLAEQIHVLVAVAGRAPRARRHDREFGCQPLAHVSLGVVHAAEIR